MDIRGSRWDGHELAKVGRSKAYWKGLEGSRGLFLAQEKELRLSVPLQLPDSSLLITPRKHPFVVRGSRRKVLVSGTLENRKENAYNTSLLLSFSRNLHLASFTHQVPLGREFRRN